MKDLIEAIKQSEGFRGEPYNDTLSIPTIGYGTKLPITQKEAELILTHRLDDKIAKLVLNKPFIERLSLEVQSALFEMSYQLGVGGLLKFKKMWLALERKDFNRAAKEALDSRWAKQTPNRAHKLSEIIRKG